MKVSESIYIDDSEISFSFAKASGSGGQKVNKTNSQVLLRWNFESTLALSDSQKNWMRNKLSSKLTVDGEIIVASEIGRSQHLNRQDCIKKFKNLLIEAAFKPKPRKKTRPSRGSKEKRLTQKKQRGDIKKSRQKKYD